MIKRLSLFVSSLVVISCGQQAGSKAMSEYQAWLYNQTLEKVKSLESRLSGVSSYSMQEVEAYQEEIERLRFNNDTTGMEASDKDACLKLERRIGLLKRDAEAVTFQRLQTIRVSAAVNDDCLLEKTTAYPVYLERGDILFYNIGLQKPATVNLYDANARTRLKTYAKTTKVADSLVIANKGIYLVEVVPGGAQYADIDITYQMADHSHPFKTVQDEEIECKAGDFRAVPTKGVIMKPAFDQPRKFTLSSQLKATFNSAAKSIAVVAVQVPSGTTDILYNLRISTSEQDRSSDGKFPDNMNLSYKKVRFLGLPLYETSYGSGLFSTLLDDNRPIREEDAYCNMYVFRSQTSARQFQDGVRSAYQLPYDLDYSTLGTQSCNGRIPAKGAKTIYLAFENERVRYANYIWVEVLTAVPVTEYHSTRYFVE